MGSLDPWGHLGRVVQVRQMNLTEEVARRQIEVRRRRLTCLLEPHGWMGVISSDQATPSHHGWNVSWSILEAICIPKYRWRNQQSKEHTSKEAAVQSVWWWDWTEEQLKYSGRSSDSIWNGRSSQT